MTDPIVDAVCAKLQSRSAVGLKKYGTTLADNPATVKEKLIHIQEELMDAANYVEWLLQEKEMSAPMLNTINTGEYSVVPSVFHYKEKENPNLYGVSPAIEAVKIMEKEMPTPMTIEMEADKRQAALASLKREYKLNGSNPYNWFIRDYYDILCAALQSPRFPVIDTNRLEDAIWYCREDWQEKDGLQTLYDEMDIIIKYARACAELQKGA